MAEERETGRGGSARVLIIALLAVILAPGLALVAFAINQSLARETEPVNVLASSTDDCVSCHRNSTPGIVEQYGHSTMAAANVSCRDCHEVTADYPGAVEHEGTHVLNTPTTTMCEKCHAPEVAQYNQSRHGLPAYVAVVGEEALPPQHREL